jgi:hypothetical protein
MPALRSQVRAAEYHAKASEAAARAAASPLQRVRELHELAACRWRQLAEFEDRRTLGLARRFEHPAQGKAAKALAVLDQEPALTA